MPIPIINSIASWVLKQRIHQIELFLKYPNEVQEELLMNLIRRAENTVIGAQYEFSSITSYSTFSERVPVASYEDLQPLIERTRQGEQNVFGMHQLNGLLNPAEPPMPKVNLSLLVMMH